MEYNVEDVDANFPTQEGLEKLLKEKSKKLETSVIQLKVSLSQKESELQAVTEQLTKAEQTETNLRQLVSKLEEDIRKGVSIQPTSQELVNPNSSPVKNQNEIFSLFF